MTAGAAIEGGTNNKLPPGARELEMVFDGILDPEEAIFLQDFNVEQVNIVVSGLSRVNLATDPEDPTEAGTALRQIRKLAGGTSLREVAMSNGVKPREVTQNLRGFRDVLATDPDAVRDAYETAANLGRPFVEEVVEMMPESDPEPKAVVLNPVVKHTTIASKSTPAKMQKPSVTRERATSTSSLTLSQVVAKAIVRGELPETDSSLTDEEKNEEDLSWQKKAICAQTDPEIFFPEKGGSTREAKKVCLGCDVRSDCLQFALSHDVRFGVWGGFSERERRKLKKRAV